jgi:hypothetical protein
MLFGAPQDTDLWAVRLNRGRAHVEAWRLSKKAAKESGEDCMVPEGVHEALLPLVRLRNGSPVPIDERYRPRDGDIVYFAVFTPEADQGRSELMARGWVPAV